VPLRLRQAHSWDQAGGRADPRPANSADASIPPLRAIPQVTLLLYYRHGQSRPAEGLSLPGSCRPCAAWCRVRVRWLISGYSHVSAPENIGPSEHEQHNNLVATHACHRFAHVIPVWTHIVHSKSVCSILNHVLIKQERYYYHEIPAR
jgi:hypothetical protein